MELKVGDRVRIKKRRGRHWNHDGKMDKWMGKIVTICEIYGGVVGIMEDSKEGYSGGGWEWRADDFEPVTSREDELKKAILPLREFARRYGYEQISAWYIDDEESEWLNAFTSSCEKDNTNVTLTEKHPKRLTLAEIEAELGYKVEIVEGEK